MIFVWVGLLHIHQYPFGVVLAHPMRVSQLARTCTLGGHQESLESQLFQCYRKKLVSKTNSIPLPFRTILCESTRYVLEVAIVSS
jgi:hypothetical protein